MSYLPLEKKFMPGPKVFIHSAYLGHSSFNLHVRRLKLHKLVKFNKALCMIKKKMATLFVSFIEGSDSGRNACPSHSFYTQMKLKKNIKHFYNNKNNSYACITMTKTRWEHLLHEHFFYFFILLIF